MKAEKHMARKTVSKKPANPPAASDPTEKTEQYILTRKELYLIDQYQQALGGLLELADPYNGGESRSISVNGFAAILKPIQDGLADLYCAVMDRDTRSTP
jgi:hypothetical protein